MSARLEVDGLTAGYGASTVLEGVTLRVEPGSITAVLGSNGAGKTTLMRALAGLLPASAGTVALDGRAVSHLPAARRVDRGLVLVPEGRLVFPGLTVDETLRIGAYAPHARAGADVRRDEMYALFPRLRERSRTRAGSLSGGEQQMLALARGLMAAPSLLLLDEPSLGLAPGMADLVFSTVAAIRGRGITVCMVEQDVLSTLDIADYAYVMEHGRLVLDGPAAALRDMPEIRSSYLGM